MDADLAPLMRRQSDASPHLNLLLPSLMSLLAFVAGMAVNMTPVTWRTEAIVVCTVSGSTLSFLFIYGQYLLRVYSDTVAAQHLQIEHLGEQVTQLQGHVERLERQLQDTLTQNAALSRALGEAGVSPEQHRALLSVHPLPRKPRAPRTSRKTGDC